MGSEEPCANPRQCNIQRKDSKLRRAVTFFKHLGLKSCSRQRTSGSSAADPTAPFDTWYNTMRANEQESEMEDTSHKHSGRAELAASNSGCRVPQSYIEKRAGNVYEMEDASINTHHAPSYPSRYTQEANPISQPGELDVEPFVTGPCPRAELASPENPFTAIGAQFEDSQRDAEPTEEMLVSPASSVGAQFEDNQRDAEPTEEMLVSPASTIGGPFNYHNTEIIALRHSELEVPSPAYKGPDTVSVPEVVDHREYYDNPTPQLTEPWLTSGNVEDFRDAVVLSTQSRIEDLREMVGILNKEWLRRCQSISDLSLRASMLSPQLLLDKGARTLQLIYKGVLPVTFDAVFALAHFACAAAYLIHGDNSSYCWNDFFQHVLNLQNLLDHASDARLFVQLVNLLFWPQCSLTQHPCGTYFLDGSSGTFVPLRRAVLGLDGRSLTEIHDSHTPQFLKNPAPMTFLQSLKSSAVFQECSRFLDGKLSLIICSTSHDLSV